MEGFAFVLLQSLSVNTENILSWDSPIGICLFVSFVPCLLFDKSNCISNRFFLPTPPKVRMNKSSRVIHKWKEDSGSSVVLQTEFLRRNGFLFVKVLCVLEDIVLKDIMRTGAGNWRVIPHYQMKDIQRAGQWAQLIKQLNFQNFTLVLV